VTKSDDFIIINGDVTLTVNAGNTVLTTTNTPNRYTFTIGSITIAQGKTLTVTSLDGSALIPYYFTFGSVASPSTIDGNLNFDATIFGGKTIASLTVSSTGSFIESKPVSLSTLANTTLTNYGTITTATLAPATTAKIENYGTLNFTGFSSKALATTTNYSGGILNTTGGFAGSITNNGTINSSGALSLALDTTKIDNYGTVTCTGFASSAIGTFTNYNSGTLNFGGTIAGNLKNYGIVNATALSGTATSFANFYNYSTGVLNFSGGQMTSTNLLLDATALGNTVNYTAAVNQKVKPVVYSNLIFSNAGTKTIETAAAGTLCTGTLSILDAAKASITNTNVIVDNLNLGGTPKSPTTYGGQSSTAAVKNSTYFTGAGYITVNSLSVAKFSANDVKLYPNPSVGGKFKISLPSIHDELKVSILNVAGKTVYSSAIAADQNADINPSSALAAGVYFVKVDQAGNSATKKLIVK
jgi:hypothetical protein